MLADATQSSSETDKQLRRMEKLPLLLESLERDDEMTEVLALKSLLVSLLV